MTLKRDFALQQEFYDTSCVPVCGLHVAGHGFWLGVCHDLPFGGSGVCSRNWQTQLHGNRSSGCRFCALVLCLCGWVHSKLTTALKTSCLQCHQTVLQSGFCWHLCNFFSRIQYTCSFMRRACKRPRCEHTSTDVTEGCASVEQTQRQRCWHVVPHLHVPVIHFGKAQTDTIWLYPVYVVLYLQRNAE